MPSTILLVDDDEFARHFSRVVLERAGYVTVEAGAVSTALELARSSNPDVVLVDFFLPDGNGAGLAQRLHAERPGLPVVLISGDASRCGAENSTDFVAVVKKPYAPAALIQAILSVHQR